MNDDHMTRTFWQADPYEAYWRVYMKGRSDERRVWTQQWTSGFSSTACTGAVPAKIVYLGRD